MLGKVKQIDFKLHASNSQFKHIRSQLIINN